MICFIEKWVFVSVSNRKIGDQIALIYQFVKRDVSARYRGSLLGMGWILLNPLLMLGLYTFAFAGILQTRWPGAEARGGVGYAMNLFAGLIVFNLFSEVAARAPGLILQHSNLVKKVVFPISIFAWVGVFAAMTQLVFSYLVINFVVSFYSGGFNFSSLAFPVVILVFIPFLLGICWFLSAIGVYFRDLSQIITLVINLFLFLSPIFYPASALPDYLSGYMWLNPLTFIIEQSRMVLIDGLWPDWLGLLVYLAVSGAFAAAGYWWFQRVRRGFADVL